jgi:hypothetical protein
MHYQRQRYAELFELSNIWPEYYSRSPGSFHKKKSPKYFAIQNKVVNLPLVLARYANSQNVNF